MRVRYFNNSTLLPTCSLRTGILDVRKVLNMGIKIGLGTGKDTFYSKWHNSIQLVYMTVIFLSEKFFHTMQSKLNGSA